MSDHYYETNWSGDYPTLCSGLWILYRDGEELDIDIPFNHSERAERGIPAGTFGTYPTWHFSDDWEEVWEDYEDGHRIYYITYTGDVFDILSEVIHPSISLKMKQIGNYFETKEEAKKAVEKLKALKRLKDKGMRTYSFKREKRGIDLDFYTLTILAPRDKDSLGLLFGGEE